MHIVEQASKNKGAYIVTKFNTGAYCIHAKGGNVQHRSKAGSILNSAKNAKLIAEMDKLVAEGMK